MPATFKISVPETFTQVILLSVEPRKAFQSEEQERTKDGTPKWTAQLVCSFRQFDRNQNEIISVTVANHGNPGDSLQPLTPVELRGLEIGVTERKDKAGAITSAMVWHRCEEIRSTASTGRSKLEVAS